MNKVLLLLLVVTLFACNENETGKQEKQNAIAEQLVGEWNNLSLEVDIHSYKNTDVNDTILARRGEWEKALRIRPIRTFFRADSTWNSAHYTLTDSLFFNPSGKWWVQGDSVVFQQATHPQITIYRVLLNGDTATFTGLIDWDEDGQKDDFYFGEQIKKK